MISWLKSLFSGIGTSLLLLFGGIRLGQLKNQNKELKADNEAYEARSKVEDTNSKLGFDERRRLLRDKWALRGVESHKTDGK